MKADSNTLAYIGAKPGTDQRDSDDWHTPSTYTEMAREVMGGIDLDPFSSKSANRSVKAVRFFDVYSNALERDWFEDKGRVFMNPPYGREILPKAIRAFLGHWIDGTISEAVVLVNNATETIWFQSLLCHATAVCFPGRRIAFENTDGKHVSGNTRGQAFFYFGRKGEKFDHVFRGIGCVLRITR